MEGLARFAWLEWKRSHLAKLEHPCGYEERFVDLVLSRVPGLDPADVVPQYPFVCSRGVARRIDFMIVNKSKGYLLPIELDGRVKDRRNENWSSNRWTDFLDRQNSIIRSFGTVLRYSNEKMFNSTDIIVKEIEEALSLQAAQKRIADQRIAVIEAAAPPPPAAPRTPAPAPPAHTAAPAKPPTAAHPVPAAAPPTPPAPPSARTDPTTRIALVSAALAVVLFVGYQFGRGSEQGQSHGIPAAALTTHTAPMGPAAPIGRPQTNAVLTTPPAADTAIRPPSVRFIQPPEASAHAGQVRTVCGQIADVKEIASGTFLSFDRPYPRESLTVVIWRQHQNSVGRLPVADGQRVCVSGLIQTYRDKPRIEVTSRGQFLP